MNCERAIEVARAVLARGSLVALEIDSRIDDFTMAFVSDPSVLGVGQPLRDLDGRRPVEDLDDAHASLMRSIPGVRTLIFEDEYALRGDAWPTVGCAYVDDRVIRWFPIDANDAAAAARKLRPGGHGVPLCGYLSSSTASEIDIALGENLTSSAIGRLAASTEALMVPLDDSDALVFLTRSMRQEPEVSGRVPRL